MKREVRSKQQTLGKHPPAQAEAAAAQGAAKPPPEDKQAQGKAANAEKMNAAKPGEFDKAGFIRAVNEAIAKQAPKNLEEADKFGDSGKAEAVKGEVAGKVGEGKDASAKAIETTTGAPPDTAAAKDKPVTALRPDQPPPQPGAPEANQAVPDKAPPAATDFSAGPQQVDQQMADAQVSEEQLAKSNEPEFTGALKEKKEGEAHAATAPGQVRAQEATILSGAKTAAATAGASAMATMTADRTKAGKEVSAGKEGAKSEDEKKREQVTAKLQKVFDVTKKDVEDILNGLDKKVDDRFSAGEKAARDAFTAEYTRKMDAYKDDRYSGLIGKGRWVKDQFAGLPSEVNVFYEQARKGYVDRMQGVISSVADVIGAELTRAKQRIATGRDELQAEVKKLPADLQAIGKQAAGEFSGKFDELTESVNDKGTALVDTLASKYTEALQAVDEQIAAEKEKNKGIIAKVVDAVKGVIDTILKLKDLLLRVLAKAAQAVVAIIKDPIGFLGKLVSGVGAGLKAFLANIASHLQKGLVSWLLGAAAKAGLQLPEKFDLKGILLLIGSLLGLSWAFIRGRVVSKGVPEQAMGAVESSVPIAQKIKDEGIGGIWEQLKEKVGDLKATLLSKISAYLVPTVIIAGITWIVSLLNPASAFIKACKAIIDIVTFIVDRGAQIMAFVNSVLDAVIAIAGGGVGGVPGLIETALVTAIPVLIGFLAALLGIGGLADKVKKLFQSLSKPVMKAVDWIVDKIAALGKKIWAKLKGKKTPSDDRRTSPQKEAALNAAVRDVEVIMDHPDGDRSKVGRVLPKVQSRYGLRSLRIVPGHEGEYHVHAAVNPEKDTKPDHDIPPELLARIRAVLVNHPALADVVVKIVKDHPKHPLNVSKDLLDPGRRERTLQLLGELAAGQLLRDRDLQTYRRECRGRGAIFDPVADDVNTTAAGRSRKQEFVDESKRRDPARDVGADPTPDQMRQLRAYATRLQRRVETEVRREVAALCPPGAGSSVRTKNADAILDKVIRMSRGSEGRPSRPNYRVGDVIDAVGARITVEDMNQLAETLRNVQRRFGVGDQGRILEIENMYAQPKSKNPDYRVIPLVVKIEVDGDTFTFELQLTTRRTSVAADVEHNTLFKEYHDLTEEQRQMIKKMQSEAAALDQEETRKMTEPPADPEELRLIRTCFVITPDRDTVAVFVIDGRRYTDPREVRRIYDDAWDEMSRRGGYEWETHTAGMTEPPSPLPSWEEFRRDLDDRYPILGDADS